ncbi:MAG: hypothetical protein HC801_08145 [Nitrospira sp.]|nr:hypothetical protein [Nitrospira sp.]
MRTLKTGMILIGLVVLAGCSSSKNHASSYIKQPEVCIDHWYGYHLGTGCPSTTKAVVPDPTATRIAALESDRQRLANELEAARRENGTLSSRVSELERQLGERDREIAALRSGSRDSAALSSQLAAARGDLSQSQDEKDRLAAELAAAKQRNADLEGQLAGLRGDLSEEMAKLKEAERGLIRALRPQINKGDITIHLNDERLLINLASGYLFASGQDQLKTAGADALKQVGGS